VKAAARLIATWFYCGYVPVAPGTVGSAAAILIAWLLVRFAGLDSRGILVLGIALIAPSMWAAGLVSAETGVTDPGMVVVDEVVGQWIAVGGATHLNWKSWCAAFVLFRLLDIWKPPPARQLERLRGGAGIVMDDVAAGAYGALVLFAAGVWFNLY
jgi:phosphatidylglycerophosphatase A